MLIAEVSQKFEISQPTLRYYEKIGLLDCIEKNASGHRQYQEKDLRRIHFIKCMRQSGMSIESIKKYVDLFHEGEQTIPQRKELLIQQLELLKKELEDIQQLIYYLEHKIENYEDTLVKRELAYRHNHDEMMK